MKLCCVVKAASRPHIKNILTSRGLSGVGSMCIDWNNAKNLISWEVESKEMKDDEGNKLKCYEVLNVSSGPLLKKCR